MSILLLYTTMLFYFIRQLNKKQRRFTMTISCLKKVPIALFIISVGTVVSAGDFDENRYKSVTAQEIIINPTGFKSKRVQLETKMVRIAINIPTYISHEYSQKKYCHIVINPKTLPLIAKIKDFQDKLKVIKNGDKIKIFGKIKEFRFSHKNKKNWRKQRWPKYYILIDDIKVIDKKNKKQKGK